jgi:N-acetylmuramoyl-L-alanine amidase
VNVTGAGARGKHVRDIQARLHALGYRTEPDAPGVFGTGTETAVREFQQRRLLLVDGLVGQGTWQEMVEAGYALGDRTLYLRHPMVRGDDVRVLQSQLNLLGFDAGKEDGIFGPRTDRAARDFQRNVGLPDDGIVGASTIEAFSRLLSGTGTTGGSLSGPGFTDVLEREQLRQLSPTHILGATIAIDAGHGGDDRGAIGPTGLEEAAVAFDLAQRLARRLEERGALPKVLRDANSNPTASQRARTANDAEATLLVSIHLNSDPEPRAEGATVFYCGRPDWISSSGQRLAELVLEQLTGLGLIDGRTHAMWLQMLRETRMPAVHVEPCFITNPGEEDAMRSEAYREDLASAIARGIERFFEGTASAEPILSGRPLAEPSGTRGHGR